MSASSLPRTRHRRRARGRRHRHDDRRSRAARGAGKHYDFIRKQTHDADSQEWEFPAQYMFKGVPHYEHVDDPVEMLVAKMDQHGIGKAITGLPTEGNAGIALERYPDRFFPS